MERKTDKGKLHFGKKGRWWVMREVTVDLNYHRALLRHEEEYSRCSKLLDSKENGYILVLYVLLSGNPLS